MTAQKGSLLGATLLVSGTCIGGGMLALPVATCQIGFFPSLLMMLVGWLFMTFTALFLAEVSLWMEEGAHVITMASRLLGPVGKGAAWILYLFIAYASLVAYTAGGGGLLANGLSSLLGTSFSLPWAMVIFILFFGTIVYVGNIFVGRVNTLLMIGLVVSYLLLIFLGLHHVDWHLLSRKCFGKSVFIAIPLLLTIFSFQTIVPSLTFYLKKDAKAIRRSIIIGTTGALLVYIIWQGLVMGTIVYEGEFGLEAALRAGKPASEFLGRAIGSPLLKTVGDFFAFFALVTSFLGIALGLYDFLADGLKIKRDTRGKVLLGILIALPTLFFALRFERIFLLALDSSGGIGDSLLNGLLPALMLWVGRYRKKLFSEYPTIGGKPLILIIILYALFVFTIEILGKLGVITSLGGYA